VLCEDCMIAIYAFNVAYIYTHTHKYNKGNLFWTTVILVISYSKCILITV